MTEILLIRHAINDWVSTGRLAGWTSGVHLNTDGKAQAAALGERLKSVSLAAIFASPLERTMETAEAIATHYPKLQVKELEGVGEVRFGKWQGEKLDKLRKEPMWHTVQMTPSRAQFPGGETFREAQMRAVDALEVLVQQRPKQRIAVVSHSDVIKLIVAHYLGVHLDLFQRIDISPASISIIQLGGDRPFVRCVNDTSHNPPLAPPPPSVPTCWQRLRRIWRSHG
ncbi:MAG: MSMEG_4193 family putative phosphomutase [Anaerolineae bacterium]|nr:MSMEG_4193 family putative phosphomutase [Anaerolineae bacterium]